MQVNIVYLDVLNRLRAVSLCECDMKVASGKAASRDPQVAQTAHCFANYDRTLTTNCSLVLRSSLRFSPLILEEKRDCSQSISSTKKFASDFRKQLVISFLT